MLILLANVGFEGGNVFYNAFLPDIADDRERDYLSSAGFAFGYLGGVLVLIASLAFFVPPRGSVHNAFLLIGLWWGGWALLTFVLLRERPARKAGRVGFGAVLRELGHTIGGIRRTPNAAWFLLAFLLYNDGIATLISNATPYALQNIFVDGTMAKLITLNELIPVMIMIQLIAFPGAIFCGWLATRYGEKRTLYFILIVFTTVVTYGQVVQVLWEFYIMGAMIGVVLGGGQAISRSLFASLVPPGKNAEFFGFYAISSKVSAMIGPFVYGGLLLLTGDTRLALLSLTLFFLAGGLVLFFRVNVEKGREEAQAQG
ncbi:MAG: MFS transporter [Candidatus Glassbacteria bacterium]|nr:MFS transporter [Candidatus Glassbacteria bacterium]